MDSSSNSASAGSPSSISSTTSTSPPPVQEIVKLVNILNPFENEFMEKLEAQFIEDPVLDGPAGLELSKATIFHDVTVLHVEDPDNFFVQPTGETGNLIKLMEDDMNTWYNSNLDKVRSVQPESVEIEGFYVLFVAPTRSWSRINVRNILDGNRAQVLLIDHGYECTADLENIFPLHEVFCEFSAGAIPAKLHVDTPILWSPEEITKFKSDVEGKQFLCGIFGRNFREEIAPYEILSMILIQTDPEDDSFSKLYTLDKKLKFCYHLNEQTDEDDELQTTQILESLESTF